MISWKRSPKIWKLITLLTIDTDRPITLSVSSYSSRQPAWMLMLIFSFRPSKRRFGWLDCVQQPGEVRVRDGAKVSIKIIIDADLTRVRLVNESQFKTFRDKGTYGFFIPEEKIAEVAMDGLVALNTILNQIHPNIVKIKPQPASVK